MKHVPALSQDSIERIDRGAPAWVRDVRRRGLDAYHELAMPSQKDEVWRYVDLDFDLDDFALPSGERGPFR